MSDYVYIAIFNAVLFSLILAIFVLPGCSTAKPASNAAICEALGPVLPSWSSKDTEQSKREGAIFLDVFYATCERSRLNG